MLTLDGVADLPVMVMGYDIGLGKINLITKRHILRKKREKRKKKKWKKED